VYLKALAFFDELPALAVEYIKDVLVRVDTHPASRIDELLPHKSSPPLRWVEPS
jgi:hypothetical protein